MIAISSMARASWRDFAKSLFVTLACSSCLACGYTPLHGGAGSERLHVVLTESKVPDAVATDEVLAGLREELARGGALASGTAFPRCEVEVLRADEAAEGIAAEPDGAGGYLPRSRGTRVALVGRAWIRRNPDAERERDTGDVRAVETVAVAVDARAGTFQYSDALRAAGRRLGKRLAARILGRPSPSEE